MNLKEIKTLLAGTIKAAFANKKTLDKFDDTTGTLKYNGVPVNNVPVFVADDAPVGNIISFMGNTAPKDYLICDGAEYNIADYPLLVQHFVDEFGSANYFGGDGETTFCVPDLRGEFLRGTGKNGDNVGKHQDGSEIPTIFYNYVSDNDIQLQLRGAKTLYPTNTDNYNSNKINVGSRIQSSLAKVESAVSLTSTAKVRPTNTAVLYCIKYQITQNNISKDMVNYSLEEQVIGSWIDGKPLYQLTITGVSNDSINNSIVLADLSDKSIDNITNITGILKGYMSTNGTVIDTSYLISGNQNKTEEVFNVFVATGFKIGCYTPNELRLSRPVTVIVEYTKTTDAENSFTPDMLSNISSFNTTVTDEDVNDVIGGI